MQSVGNILGEGVTTVGVESRLELARWSSGNPFLVGGVLSIVALYAVWWMYRREARGRMSKPLRWSLAGCRMMVLMLLGLIGLEPVFVRYDHRRVDAQTIVLVDDSASMSLSDPYRNADDAARVRAALGEPAPDGVNRRWLSESLLTSGGGALIDKLAARNDVRLFAFSDSLTPLGVVPRRNTSDHAGDAASSSKERESNTVSKRTRSDDGALNAQRDQGGSPIGLTAGGSATDLTMAVRGALDAAAGAPVAGVVVLTDGGFNRGESPSAAARLLNQRQIPALAVGVGDPEEPVNARIVQMSAPRSAFKNDPFSVNVRIEVHGGSEQDVRLELFEQFEGGGRELIATKEIHADSSGRYPPAVFERRVEMPGTVRYAARISPLAFESIKSDNERELSPAVRILDDQMKVLLISGAPSYDYRFLARLLERDRSVRLSTWLQSADTDSVREGDEVITSLPTTPEEINQYDALILMDCDPSDFDPTWASIVATYVSDHGGGLLYAAGNKYTGRFLKHANLMSIVELLPVVTDPEAELVINELGHYQLRPWPILIPEEAAGDAILRQSDDASQTRSIWGALGSVYWHYPVLRGKPIAQMLMRHSNPRMVNAYGPHVLFATQFVGTGRTAWLGINSTWRWRRSDETHFNRFWIQTLRYLVEGKLLGGRTRGQILTAKEEYEIGETVVVTVRALDERFNPLLVPELDMDIVPLRAGDVESTSTTEGNVAPSSARTIELTPIVGREGYYEGRFVANADGALRLLVRLPGQAGREGNEDDRLLVKELDIVRSDIEMQNTAMNRAAIREFVNVAGGRSGYFDVDEIDRIAEKVPDMSRTFTVRGRPRPVWDNAIVLIVLLGFLSLEWILRKKARLL